MSGRCVWKVSGSTWQVDIRKITNDDVSQLHLRNSQPRNGAQDEHKNEHKLWANNLQCKQLHSNHSTDSTDSTDCRLSVQCEHPEWSGQKHSKEKVKDMKECSWSYNSIDLFWQLPITHSQFSRCLPVECSCMAPSTLSNVTFSVHLNRVWTLLVMLQCVLSQCLSLPQDLAV